MCSFNKTNTEGTDSSNICVMLVHVCFMFVKWLVLWIDLTKVWYMYEKSEGTDSSNSCVWCLYMCVLCLRSDWFCGLTWQKFGICMRRVKGLILQTVVSDVCACVFYVCEVIGFVDWLDKSLVYVWEEWRDWFFKQLCLMFVHVCFMFVKWLVLWIDDKSLVYIYIYMYEKSFEMCLCLWPESECPEATLCGWH